MAVKKTVAKPKTVVEETPPVVDTVKKTPEPVVVEQKPVEQDPPRKHIKTWW